jgi:TrmH family RNA methyltransferase
MASITRLTSPENPRIKAVVRLRRQRERRRTGQCIAEGEREIARAGAAGLPVRSLFYCPSLLANEQSPHPETPTDQGGRFEAIVPESVQRVVDGQTACFEVTERLAGKMSALSEPAGLLAVVDQPGWSLSQLPTVSEATLYLVAVGIGAMARTAAAAGCEALLLGDSVVDAFHPHAIRNSTGAVFSLPTIALPRDQLVEYCQAQRVALVATTLHRAVPYTEAPLTGPVAIAVGPEDTGLDADWHAAADATDGQRVTIPIHADVVDSLNAASAAAVVLFEARRQRG